MSDFQGLAPTADQSHFNRCSHETDDPTKGPPKIPTNPPHAEQAGLAEWITSGGWRSPAPPLLTKELLYRQCCDCISSVMSSCPANSFSPPPPYGMSLSEVIQGYPPHTHHLLDNTPQSRLPRYRRRLLLSYLIEIYIVWAAPTHFTVGLHEPYNSNEKVCLSTDLPLLGERASRCWWPNLSPVKQEWEKHPAYDDYIGGSLLLGSKRLAVVQCDYRGPQRLSGFYKVFSGVILLGCDQEASADPSISALPLTIPAVVPPHTGGNSMLVFVKLAINYLWVLKCHSSLASTLMEVRHSHVALLPSVKFYGVPPHSPGRE